MTITIALLSPGAMGSAVGARLVDGGARVLTSLGGRGAASRERAAAAGMIEAEEADLVAADMILSILPPGEAEALLHRLLPAIEAAATEPLYLDLNACSPATKRRLAEAAGEARLRFVDGAIIGPPPLLGRNATAIYVSGPHAAAAAPLGKLGLDLRVMDGPVGAASALKMSYAGINKGLVGLGTAMLLGAARAGAAEDLRAEMQASMPDLLARFERQLPDMYPKAYRWVAEMREIAGFLDEDPAARMIFEGLAQLYARIAADAAGARTEIALLDDPLGRTDRSG